MQIKGHMEELKRILIVDDSEIDRTVLRSILEHEFEVYEANNGYSALDMIITKRRPLDAILLDISMPILDGLSVLRIMRENELENIPVFMITAEATKDNIEKAIQYNIKDFIRKPFDREVVLQRIRDRLGVTAEYDYNESDMDQTRRYISDLESIYNQYVMITGKDKWSDECRAYLMATLMRKQSGFRNETHIDKFWIEMLSRAAYLCNIGNMLLFDIVGKKVPEASAMYQQHTVLGSKLVQLNYSGKCKHFVNLCSDICLHHHERYDGKGFPDGIGGNSLSVYAQVCGLIENFDKLFYPCGRHNEIQFDYVVDKIAKDNGLVSDEIFSLLIDSKTDIVRYYNRYID